MSIKGVSFSQVLDLNINLTTTIKKDISMEIINDDKKRVEHRRASLGNNVTSKTTLKNPDCSEFRLRS